MVIIPQVLINQAAYEGIHVMFSKLEGRILAYYAVDAGQAFIVLSESLKKDTAILRCVLAEELGHHYTSVGIGVPVTHTLYRDRNKLTQDEHRAKRWAAEYLLPLDKLLRAFRKGIRHLWELAEYFRVTEEMIRFRLKMLKVGMAS
ncbi:ImmA/IrrE family metallo-endopeptidase [Desmospora activa]|uniref:Uncharacterized protein DUF955 n=1 Tax=Desmospora activa DSM 45169 TaxID=1121389 RepID=A0A2T4ZCI0_9BACL|nr:ImmA/IrrE family metallo-endopeptidase [Desmospora activa]PTM59586.1 uncharacterized protein DUF955 [Desmospora activa DSM 45169]